MGSKTISSAVIKRLPRYYRYLGDLLENGIERISSKELSIRMKVTASQIRQDLNNFGGFGQQGYGYQVRYLHDEIGKILGLDAKQSMIIIGAGNLGTALAKYDFSHIGFRVAGIFDVRADVIGTEIGGIRVSSFDTVEVFLKEHDVQVAVLTIPRSNAHEAAERLVKAGIGAIWNFAPIDLQLDSNIVVKNVHLDESLMTLSYNNMHKGQERLSYSSYMDG